MNMKHIYVTPGTLRQSYFDNVGVNKEYDTVYLESGNFIVDTPIKLNDGTVITSNPVVKANLILRNNVDPTIFQKMVPIFGQKNNTISNILIENLVFFGNDENQEDTPPWNGYDGNSKGSRRGQGYHNWLGFKNAANIIIRNNKVYKTLGDGARLTNVKGVEFYNNQVLECGHDALFIDGGQNIEAYNNFVQLRTNSAIRFRHTVEGHAYNNKIDGMMNGISTGPAFQVEVSAASATLSDILIENNEVANCYGPGVWAASAVNPATNAGSGVIIRNNNFSKCGYTPNLTNCGAIVINGFTKVLIEENIIKDCLGAGVIFSNYLSSAAGNNYTAEVRNNIFENIQKSKTNYTGTGSALCNLLTNKYTVTAKGNLYNNNYRDLYNVTEEPDDKDKEAIIILSCDTEQADTIRKTISGEGKTVYIKQ